MGNDIQGNAYIPDLFQDIGNLFHMFVIKTAGRFVKKLDRTLGCDCRGNCYPLLLSAGKGHRVSVFEAD